MPRKIMKRGKLRYVGAVMVAGNRRTRLFPDATLQSKRDAIAWENRVRQAMKRDLATPTMCLTMGIWVNEYLTDVKSRFSKTTYNEKRLAFKRYIAHCGFLEYTPVKDQTVQDVRTFLAHLNDTISGNTANCARKNLARAWRWGRRNIDNWPEGPNLFRRVERFKEKRHPRYVPSLDDFWRVYEVAEGQDRVMLLAFLHLGARRNEVFGLKHSDIDFGRQQARLWTKKRDSGLEYDWVPMTDQLTSILSDWCKRRTVMSTVNIDHVFVCLSDTAFCDQYYGKPFTCRAHFMRRLCDQAGVKPFGFHAIRHLTATELMRAGVPIKHIQIILRHKSQSTTERYLHGLGLEVVRESLNNSLESHRLKDMQMQIGGDWNLSPDP